MAIEDAISQVQGFKRGSLAKTIEEIETQLTEADTDKAKGVNQEFGIDLDLIRSAAAIKQASAQIDVVIHAVGMLYALPHILREDEVVEALSLGAGSAKCDFDLVTDRRIAEFKFIQWQPKGNAVRNKTLFQDYFKLVRVETRKQKYLYLLDTEIPLRFLQGDRNAFKVLDRNRRLADDFRERYGQTYRSVGDFYRAYRDEVQTVALAKRVPELTVLLQDLATKSEE